jgi:hypothetical protein
LAACKDFNCGDAGAIFGEHLGDLGPDAGFKGKLPPVRSPALGGIQILRNARALLKSRAYLLNKFTGG